MREPLALQRRTFTLPRRIRHLAFSPDGAALAAATDGPLVVIDLATGSLRTHRAPNQGLVWTTRGLVAIGHDRVTRVGKHTKTIPPTIVAALTNRDLTTLHDDTGALAGTLPASWRAAVRGRTVARLLDGHLVIHDAVTREETAHHLFTAYHVTLSPDGTRLLASGQTGGAWEGPCAGPLTWYPESGELAHGGASFAIGRTLYRRGDPTPTRVRVHDVSTLAFSPDGSTLAIGSHSAVQLVSLAAIAAWPSPVGPEDQLAELAADPTHDRIAAIDRNGLVCVWQASDRRLRAAFHVDPGEHPIAFAGDGALLVGTHGLEVWDGDAGVRRAAHPIPGLLRSIDQLAVAGDTIAVRDHTRVALLNADGSVRRILWPGEDRLRIRAIALSPGGRLLGVARESQPAMILDTTTFEVRRELPPADAIVLGDHLVARSSDSAGTLGTLTGDDHEEILPFTAAIALGDAILWKYGDRVGLRAPREIRLDVRYTNTPYAVTRAVDPARFLTAGDRWLGERALADGTLRRVFAAGASGKVTALAFDPTGERLAVGESDGRLHVWQLGPSPARIAFLDGTTLQPAGTLREPGRVGEISDLAFTTTELIAAASEVLAWDLANLATLATAVDRVVPVAASRVARDGSRTFLGGHWGNEYVVHDATGAELSKGPGIEDRDRHTDLSDDGRRVLVGNGTELSVLRDTGELLGTLRVDTRVQCARFDAHGRVIGVVDDDGPWFRWDPAAAQVQRWIPAPPVERFNIDIVARGPGRVVIAHSGGLSVLDEDTGTILANIGSPGPHNPTCVALSYDGRLLAVGDWSGQVRIHALGDRPDHTPCLAALSGTTEGGWWSLGPAGFNNFRGDAMTREWGAE